MERTKYKNSKIPDAVNCSPTKIMAEQQTQLIALEAFSSDSFLSINKQLLSKYGPELTIYLCNLIDKMNYFLHTNKLGEDLSFFLTHADQEVHTGMNDYQLRKCKKKLKEMGILYTEMRGIPPKEFYTLDLEKIVNEFLRNIPLKFKGINPKNLEEWPSNFSRNNKETKYKETKSKKTNNTSDSASPNGKITPAQFEDFWKAYPRHVDKGKAKSAWEKLCKKNNEQRPAWTEIESSIEAQKESDRWKDKKFIPHPTTWLNQQRWLDDPKEMKVYNYSRASNLPNAYHGPDEEDKYPC
jgi:hypothetical protein